MGDVITSTHADLFPVSLVLKPNFESTVDARRHPQKDTMRKDQANLFPFLMIIYVLYSINMLKGAI